MHGDEPDGATDARALWTGIGLAVTGGLIAAPHGGGALLGGLMGLTGVGMLGATAVHAMSS